MCRAIRRTRWPRRTSQHLAQQPRRRRPRAPVRVRLVEQPARRVARQLVVGEAVAGAAVGHELPVGAGRLHLALEGPHVLLAHQRVEHAVEREDARLHRAPSGAARRVEQAVEADRRGEIGAVARQLQRHAAPEAIAERRDLAAAHQRAVGQACQPGAGAGAEQGDVAGVPVHLVGRLLVRLRPHAAAVEVEREGDVTQRGQRPGSLLDEGDESPPHVANEDAGARPGEGGVEGGVALERDAVVGVGDALGPEGGVHRSVLAVRAGSGPILPRRAFPGVRRAGRHGGRPLRAPLGGPARRPAPAGAVGRAGTEAGPYGRRRARAP